MRGLAYVPQAADLLASKSLRVPPCAAQAAHSNPQSVGYAEQGAENKNARLRGHFLILAEWTGLEPATPGVTGRYSNQLNYHS